MKCLICNHQTKLLEEKNSDGMLSVEHLTVGEAGLVIFNLQQRIAALEEKVLGLSRPKAIVRPIGHSIYTPAKRKGAR